jgi:hypothetical protein
MQQVQEILEKWNIRKIYNFSNLKYKKFIIFYIEPYLSDNDFSYIFNWILRKEIKNGSFVKDNSDYIN